jgi:hypothetical protein
MILLVSLEVLRQLADPLAQDRDLDLRASSIRIMGAELLDNVCLSCQCQHSYSLTPDL